MTEGATEVMEGMAVGGKSCCPITVYGGATRLSLASHSGVANINKILLFIVLLVLVFIYLSLILLSLSRLKRKLHRCRREPLTQYPS